MKNTLLVTALASVSLLCSCKKENSTTDNNSSLLPKTYTEDIRSSVVGNSVTIYNLTYDGNNRLIALTATPAPPVLNFIYTYPSATTFTMELFEQGNLEIHENAWLNASSKIDSTYQFNSSGDTTTEKYIYNGNQQLIQQKSYVYTTDFTSLNDVITYTYDNLGNATQASDDNGQVTTYTYYTDLPNTLNQGQTYLPQPVNFVKTASVNNGGSTVTATHYYTFDGSNRLIKDSASTAEIDFTAIKTYTY